MNARSHNRSGGVLFEVLLSIALFAGAAALVLGVLRDTFERIGDAERAAWVHDLASSKLAELEAGLISISQLDDGEILGAGSMERFDGTDTARHHAVWTLEADVQPSEYRGLSLVTLTVREEPTNTVVVDDDQLLTVTINRLVRIHETNEDAYEEDDILRDLPAGESDT